MIVKRQRNRIELVGIPAGVTEEESEFLTATEVRYEGTLEYPMSSASLVDCSLVSDMVSLLSRPLSLVPPPLPEWSESRRFCRQTTVAGNLLEEPLGEEVVTC